MGVDGLVRELGDERHHRDLFVRNSFGFRHHRLDEGGNREASVTCCDREFLTLCDLERDRHSSLVVMVNPTRAQRDDDELVVLLELSEHFLPQIVDVHPSNGCPGQCMPDIAPDG